VPMERLPPRLRQEGFVGWFGPRGQIVTYPHASRCTVQSCRDG
jgi:hypothetical protein